ncbi:MnhB domain-containing protein [Clostridium sp.]|uniref:MnhB domain-containing protein n=1 Tax=Clostridium sp. TaxID=1506 RepID=UPI002A91C38F|nr:MnhB domain-containing protein [Clostridium sp.]MDY6012302.1 MnhB domain-containing protein [Clostridium sp.]
MDNKEKDIIVKICASITLPLALLLGIYIVLHGHLSPGGGFQGGVIIASAVLIFYIAYGREKTLNIFSKSKFSKIEEVGALTFIFVASLGIIYGVSFFSNVLNKGSLGNIFSSGTIFFMNFAVGYKVLAGISVLILVMISCLKEGEKRDGF